MKIAVLGAGVTGLTAARLLKENGHEVIVYEKNNTPGGLARSRYVDGKLYDPHGGHIFNSKHKKVVDWVFSILPKDKWQFTERNAKIFFNGRYVSYPFELSLCELETNDAVNCVYDFIMSQQGEEPDNYRDWLYWNFGKSIADFYMIPYNEKIWAYPLEQMETHWMQGKMPLPTKKEMIKSMLLKDPKERKMPHSTFYYPVDGGIQAMVNAMSMELTIITGVAVECIEHLQNKKWIVNGKEDYDFIISTIPLPVLGKVMKTPPDIENALGKLKYNSLTTILFDCPKTDITWLYVPSNQFRSHRVGYQSTLTPHARPEQDKYGLAALEIIGSKFIVDDNILKNNIVLPKELGFDNILDTEFSEFAYVIHDLDYAKNTTKVRNYFTKLENFETVGRWGSWNYKNMDLCILDAMELVERLENEWN